jgi:glyoxylase-like metal-dependent hydrolase (beta-lactamase superfamily II)
MKIYPIETGNFKLDGGAMFGVVPKTLWQRTNPADSKNLIDMSMRSMLIEDGNRLILIDTGCGNKQSDKFFSYYYLFGDFSLDSSLAKHGFHRDDITDVFLTHLHFDHCGGAIQFNKDRTGYEPAFKNAKFWSNANHWQWAVEPNIREKASFLKENINPIEASGQLNFVNISESTFVKNSELGFDIFFADGHTEKQMIPHILYKGQTIVFMADLLPTVGHIPLPYVMGYDTRPLLTMNEKANFLNKAADNNYLLFLEHDATNELCTVKHTEKGVRLKETYKFSEVFN